jgi:stringent starvation protein B
MTMTTHRPYMLRALNEWIIDNGCTPYILVNALFPGVQVPLEYVKDGQIVLNISPLAVRALSMNNKAVQFQGRFGGMPTDVYIPCSAILGIYAKENGQGMIFETDDPIPEPPSGDGEASQLANKPRSRRPSLRVVK